MIYALTMLGCALVITLGLVFIAMDMKYGFLDRILDKLGL